ncbi:MAG: hypothetical protein K0S74_1159 [Chlamydiales bacterium]|jgi:hypothetical protein|nr:hypothetical protein [Chlamydiales bacterium]
MPFVNSLTQFNSNQSLPSIDQVKKEKEYIKKAKVRFGSADLSSNENDIPLTEVL